MDLFRRSAKRVEGHSGTVAFNYFLWLFLAAAASQFVSFIAIGGILVGLGTDFKDFPIWPQVFVFLVLWLVFGWLYGGRRISKYYAIRNRRETLAYFALWSLILPCLELLLNWNVVVAGAVPNALVPAIVGTFVAWLLVAYGLAWFFLPGQEGKSPRVFPSGGSNAVTTVPAEPPARILTVENVVWVAPGTTVPAEPAGRGLPFQHRLLPVVPYWVANIVLAVVIAAAWPLSRLLDNQLNPYFLDLVIRVGVAIILAVSLNLINGITGQFSLGHAGFMGLGAYVCGVLVKHWAVGHGTGITPPPAPNFIAVTVLAGVVAALAGLAIGIPALRLRGDYLAIATLGFGEIIALVINQVQAFGGRTVGQLQHVGGYEVGGPAGLHDIPVATNFFWTFLWCVLCIGTVWRLAHSAKGKAFYAVREDEIAAAAMGVNTTFHKVTAFTIGAFFAGVAGALSATFTGNLSPGSFNFMRSIEIVVMVVLGGSGSISGAILAAIVLTWLPEQLRFLSAWRLVIYAVVLIVMMIVRPEGLLGSRELWFARRRSSVAPPTADAPVEGL